MKSTDTLEQTLTIAKNVNTSSRQLFKAKKLVLEKQASSYSAKSTYLSQSSQAKQKLSRDNREFPSSFTLSSSAKKTMA